MTVVLITLGLLLVAAALLDQAWTTVAAGHGGGPLTRRLAAGLWRMALRLQRRFPKRGILAAAGPTIIFTVFGAWVATVLVGWSLVYLSAEGAVRNSNTHLPGGTVDRIYYAGFTVFTLGTGDYRPGSGVWQMATVAATLTGLVLVTLGITYLVPVAAAVTQRRQLANTIASLGGTGEDIVLGAWDGNGFGSLLEHLRSLLPDLITTRQRHLTYPVLHYFHSVDRGSAAAVQLTHLIRAVEVLRLGVAPDVRPDRLTLEALHRAMGWFLETLAEAFIRPHEDAVPAVSLSALRAAGIPTVSDVEYAAAVDTTERRRRLLAGFLIDDGWTIDDAVPPARSE